MDKNSSCMSAILGPVLFIVVLWALKSYVPSLFSLLMGIAGFILFLIAVLIGLILYIVFRKPKKGSPAAVKAETKAILSKGRSNLAQLRRLGMKVKNNSIRELSTQICSSADKILKVLKEKPESIPAVRQFLNYYLPTLGSILNKYVRVEESGVPSGDMVQKVVSNLSEIEKAMEKQYSCLFDDDMLDLSVEMEALTIACKRDGLLSDDDFKSQDGNEAINLTL